MYSSRAQPESSSEWWLGWRGTTPAVEEDPSAPAPPPEAPCWLTAGDDCPALAAPAAELSMEALRLVLGLPVLLEVPEVVPGEQLVPAWTARLLGATPPADIRNGSKE